MCERFWTLPRPVLDLLWQSQRPHEVGEIVGQSVKLQPDGVAGLAMAGCADLSETEQLALTGTAIGTAGGAAVGAIADDTATGAAISAGVQLEYTVVGGPVNMAARLQSGTEADTISGCSLEPDVP